MDFNSLKIEFRGEIPTPPQFPSPPLKPTPNPGAEAPQSVERPLLDLPNQTEHLPVPSTLNHETVYKFHKINFFNPDRKSVV